jgi:hypothetical protein
MNIKKTLAGIAFAVGAFTSMAAYALGIEAASPARPATEPRFVVLALTPQQAAQCQQEQARLSQQLSQCSNDACRQQMRAAIAAHNARCQ